MDNLFIKETWVNKTRDLLCGDSGVYETYTDDKGQLFRSLQKEYGRCISKLYIDPNGKQIGWVFEKKQHYTDTGDPYILETWVELHSKLPTKTIEYHYA